MLHYYAIVHHDEDSAFGLTFPDLPGCFSASDTLEGVIPNGIEALDSWFADTDVVAPSDLATIAAGAAEDLANGAFVIAVPWVERSGQAKRINISIDGNILAAIDRAAQERDVTRSAFIAAAAQSVMIRTGA